MFVCVGVVLWCEVEWLIEVGCVKIGDEVVIIVNIVLIIFKGVIVDDKLVRVVEVVWLFVFYKLVGLLIVECDLVGWLMIYIVLCNVLLLDVLWLMLVGWFDFNIEGLLMLINDGELKWVMELLFLGIFCIYCVCMFGLII